MTSLLLLGTALVSSACTSTPTEEAPEPAKAIARNDVDEPTLDPDQLWPTPINTPTPEEMPEEISPALVRDAQMYAAQHDVELPEAITRLLLQDSVGELDADLLSNESGTFGGIWIQNEPEYRVVVAFTKDGEETVAKYVKDEALMSLIEVRTVEATYQDLMQSLREASWMVAELGFRSVSDINLFENRVEVYTPDRARMEEALQKNGKTLPAHVHIVERKLPARPEGG